MNAGKNANPAIFALSTAAGRAGVAVIRISGVGTGTAVEALAGPLPTARVTSLRDIRDPTTREMLDRGLVLWFPGPRSFTGDDVAELHLHGSRAVVQAVCNALLTLGLRIAEPGEFTKRAFENGKMDLTEVEGLADLIAAETSAQRRQALSQLEGGLRTLFEGWRTKLVQAMALVEASLDFADEADVAAEAFAMALPIVSELHTNLTVALREARSGEVIREGVQVAIIGAPNVGKSSLLNALSRRDVAIVFDEPGTTRDVIEVTVDIDGFPFVFRDTAGLRETDSPVEREGIKRSIAAAQVADLVLEVLDATAPFVTPPSLKSAQTANPPSIVLVNKIDVGAIPEAFSGIAISAKTGAGICELRAALASFAVASYGPRETAAITRARHRQEIEGASSALARFKIGVDEDYPFELLAEDLRNAATAIGRLTGAVDAEDVLGAIFSEFCIGK